MLYIRLICVGKLKEKFYTDASKEYLTRLSGYCKIDIEEIPEFRLPEQPGEAEITAALKAEAEAIGTKRIKGAAVIALCIEGMLMDSNILASQLEKYASEGVSRLCFIIGGSYGLHSSIKEQADIKLSMSPMTFPHHLARIMLLEQIYRGFKISEGGKYHK
jgi:23S rRNA (pseudouridine1915-N3)-methyltransferase